MNPHTHRETVPGCFRCELSLAAGEVETPPIVFGPDLGTPPWADGVPNIHAYVESEIAVAGALSTMPPFDVYHPTYALPFARAALDALSKWEPTDG